jgi:hypothetical protein
MKTTDTPNEKKNPMRISPFAALFSRASVTAEVTLDPMIRSTDMNLLYEALSRARMRQPLDEASEHSLASDHGRGARRVAMQARQRQAHELGDVSKHVFR